MIFRCKTREKTRQTGEISPKAKNFGIWGGGGVGGGGSKEDIFRKRYFQVGYFPDALCHFHALLPIMVLDRRLMEYIMAVFRSVWNVFA